MSRQARWLFLFVFLALVVGLMFGLRFAVTFQDAFRHTKYIPIRGTACVADTVTEYDGVAWQTLWPVQ